MFSDLKFALRSLRNSPGFAVVVVLILALGIGANTAIFSLFHQILLRPLPVPEPDRLVNLSAPGPKPGRGSGGIAGSGDDVFSYPMFRDLQRVQRAFTGIAALQPFKANLAYQNQLTDGVGFLVSGSYFAVLGLRPALGRLIGPTDDDKVGEAGVAVLSYSYWQSRFAASPNVLNEVIFINGQPLTIVGVAPRGFEGTALGVRPQVFAPITMKEVVYQASYAAVPGFDSHRDFYWVNLFARLKPGISIDRARVLINAPYRAILNDVEAPQLGMSPQTMVRFRAKEIVLEPGAQGRSMIREPMSTPFMLLLGVTVLVLLIACANIANLLLARTAARTGEIALRVSLGATPWTILAQLLTESCLLAACSGILGVAFAYWTLHLIELFLPAQYAEALSLSIDGAALLFAIALTLGAALLFGLFPALRSTRVDLLSKLKAQSGPLAGGRGGARIRASLIASQTVMAMMLLVSAGLLIQSLANVGRVDLGLKVDSLVTFSISPELNGYTPERSQRLFARLEDELAATPGAIGVTASSTPILTGQGSGSTVSVQGVANTGDGLSSVANFNKIGAGYFRTLGIPLIAGREFSRRDAAGAGKVAIVNQQFVKKFNLGTDAVGKWMSSDGNDPFDTQIVGVVQDTKYDKVKDETPPQFFLPYRQDSALGALSFYVRAAMTPEHVLSLATKAVARLDPNLPIEDPKSMARQVEDNVFLDRLVSVLCTAFATLATLLAAVGLYGMLAYAVAQRTKEIGVRMALGAQRRAVAWPIVRNALWLTGIGVAIGGVTAVALGKVIRGILFGVEPDDPIAIVGAALFLLAVASIAAWIPAWRASRIDPMIALRTE